jgi:hypothetical protein
VDLTADSGHLLASRAWHTCVGSEVVGGLRKNTRWMFRLPAAAVPGTAVVTITTDAIATDALRHQRHRRPDPELTRRTERRPKKNLMTCSLHGCSQSSIPDPFSIAGRHATAAPHQCLRSVLWLISLCQ